jgi:hypothetical protein
MRYAVDSSSLRFEFWQMFTFELAKELMKLKKKINNTVQILTHVKEKLKFVIAENEKEKEKLSIFDDEVKKVRTNCKCFAFLDHLSQNSIFIKETGYFESYKAVKRLTACR